MIHIVNGDVVGKKIGNLEGDILIWREMYDMGPLVHNCSEEEFINDRARFFEEKFGIPTTLFIDNCKNQYRMLHEIPRTTEITLWFEHDRYDQTMLMFLLHELSKRGFEKLSMVTTNQFPGIEPFYGLGQLTTEQLTDLFIYQKQTISKEQIKEGSSGWMAYTSENPHEIEKWIANSKGYLPFLKQSLQSHLEYFPSIKNGLNAVESLVLSYINNGACSFGELFQYISQKRVNDGLSDLHFSAILNQLTLGEFPLLQCDLPLPNYKEQDPHANIKLTSFGLNILKGKTDRFEYISIDWWLGGVHLKDDQWRRDQKSFII